MREVPRRMSVRGVLQQHPRHASIVSAIKDTLDIARTKFHIAYTLNSQA